MPITSSQHHHTSPQIAHRSAFKRDGDVDQSPVRCRSSFRFRFADGDRWCAVPRPTGLSSLRQPTKRNFACAAPIPTLRKHPPPSLVPRFLHPTERRHGSKAPQILSALGVVCAVPLHDECGGGAKNEPAGFWRVIDRTRGVTNGKMGAHEDSAFCPRPLVATWLSMILWAYIQ